MDGRTDGLGDLPRVMDPRGSLTLRDLLRRVDDPAAFARWQDQVARTGGCSCPVRLRGRVEQADLATGELRPVWSTDGEPDAAVLKACGTRRASRCPSCAAVYQRDAFHLIASGLRGGKGIPDAVIERPRVFATFTAPSFGPVHARRVDGSGRVLACRPRDPKRRCRHGRPVGCWRRHDHGDARLGAPVCVGCLDADGLVLWNAMAPELWRRTTVALRRELARLAGVSEAAARRLVRVTYVKVAEYQARGALHFHSVFRLDGAGGGPGEVAPPLPFTGALLVAAIRAAAERVAAPLPVPEGFVGPVPVARWGGELRADVLPAAVDPSNDLPGDLPGGLSGGLSGGSSSLSVADGRAAGLGVDVPGGRPEGVGGWGMAEAPLPLAGGVPEPAQEDAGRRGARLAAGYLAKYTVKGAEALGLPDHRLTSGHPSELATLGLPDHVARLAATAWELGGLAHLAPLRLRSWAHMLGFRGHFATKSRAFSTTFGRLRRARADYARSERVGGRVPLDAWGRPEAAGLTVRVAVWHVVGLGYRTAADAMLARASAGRAREHP